MTEMKDFVAALAMARKGIYEKKIPIDQAYDNKSLRRVQFYQIKKEVKEG
jgi:hypothetical protein